MSRPERRGASPRWQPNRCQPGIALDVRVEHGKSHVEILRCAADIGADLIVMGVHGRRQIDLEIFGSTTNQVVRQATCPVLTLRTSIERAA